MIKAILAELSRPDDQGNDWYGWAANQMSHALLGVIVALFFPGAPIEMALIVALLKEMGDLCRGGKISDSVIDTLLWVLGAWLLSAASPVLPVIAIAAALVCGIMPRIRKLHKK